jgi:hypothetical protein
MPDVPANPLISFAQGNWQKPDVPSEPMGMVSDVLAGTGYQYLPDDMPLALTRKPGPKIETPLVDYKSAFMAYTWQRFMFTWVRDTDGGLLLTKVSIEGTKILTTGNAEPGGASGIWWNQTAVDNAFEKGGAPVYERHSYWAFGHTLVRQGLTERISGQTAAVTDPIGIRNLYDNGSGSYSELTSQLISHNVGLILKYQGNDCPRFMDSLAANGGRQQLIGSGRFSVANPTLPYERWSRPSHFGARDDFAKLEGSFTSGVDLKVFPIAGNPIPDTIPEVKDVWDFRLFGVRVCGNPADGCP